MPSRIRIGQTTGVSENTLGRASAELGRVIINLFLCDASQRISCFCQRQSMIPKPT
jgi:hypothetical protein